MPFWQDFASWHFATIRYNTSIYFPIMFYINLSILSSIYFIYQCFQPGQTTNQNVAHSLLIDIWVYEQKSSWQTSTISAWSSQPKFEPISGLGPTWRSCAIISAKKIGLHKIQIFKTPTYMLQITIGIIWNPYCIFMINTTAIHTLICWPT